MFIKAIAIRQSVGTAAENGDLLTADDLRILVGVSAEEAPVANLTQAPIPAGFCERNTPFTRAWVVQASGRNCSPALDLAVREPIFPCLQYHTNTLTTPDPLLYYTILYYTVLYYTILYYNILYYTILYYTILCYHIIRYIMLCYVALCYVM